MFIDAMKVYKKESKEKMNIYFKVMLPWVGRDKEMG